MNSVLLTAVLIATTAAQGISFVGTAKVVECPKADTPFTATCFVIGTERFAFSDSLPVNPGDTIKVRFDFEFYPSPDGDTFQLKGLHYLGK